MTISRRRSRMINFRLSEEEYASLMNLCQAEGARSVSDVARDAVSRLIHKEAHTQVETALRELQGRVDTLDLQMKRLEVAVDGGPKRAAQSANGKG